jgi:DNA-directed RNA polymerase specialized sigma24 family protein
VSAQPAAAPLDLVTVRRKLRDVREALAAAVELLGELYDGRAWVALGLPSWAALCEQELPELAQLLTVDQRRAVVVELRRGHGASFRAAAAPAGVSAATAKSWCDEAGVQLASVSSLDGRVRPGSRA